jgi:hypothetical protein
MKSNINRQQEIFRDAVPSKGTKAYLDVIEKFKKIQNNPKFKEFNKKNWEKVTKSLEAQYLSNCNLITENSLRYFLVEFNNRAWKYGLRSMPLMFNIMEAFFNYIKPEIYFELIEEENYLISFFDFIDFITSKEFEDNKQLIDANITSDIIYNFNVGKDIEEINFKNDLGEEFIIAGVSIIRRQNEITVLMITGKKVSLDISMDKDPFELDTQNPNKLEIIGEFNEKVKNEGIEYEYLDEDKKYIKVLVAARIDLETMTIDARYVAEEKNLAFDVVTDEIGGFLTENGDFISDNSKDIYENSRKIIEKFNSIFEVIKYSLYLPYFFNSKDEAIVEEILDTKFKKLINNPIAKRKYSNVFGYKAPSKSLYSIDINNVFSSEKIRLRDDIFKVQNKGYWKNLELDKIGLDKNGNPIHGRTWVNQHLSWFEAKESDLIVEKKQKKLFNEANSGFIYILRNASLGKNIFKIGLTRNNVDERVDQLSNTSVPDKFLKCQEWNVRDCVKAEKEIHTKLMKYRVDPRREFFCVEYEEAIGIIKEVIDKINKE